MRFSIHIDAGYLYAALATRTTGSSNRAAIKLDEASFISGLVEFARADADLRLLRVLWYDAAKDGLPDAHQKKIGLINSVKLRMGRINTFGEQKGVDLRLGLDLVSVAVNRAVEVAYVVSGDDDLTEAVTDAQDLGLQVKLISVPSPVTARPLAVAMNLSLAVDSVLHLPDALMDATVTRIVNPTPPAPVPDEPTAVVAPVRPAGPSVVPTGARLCPPGTKPAPVPVVPPTARPVAPVQTTAPAASLVWSSRTGAEPVGDAEQYDPAVVAEVARSVHSVWRASATLSEVEALQAGRPNVPPNIDRILLTDMVNRTGLADIPEWTRFELRRQFWAAAAGQ